MPLLCARAGARRRRPRVFGLVLVVPARAAAGDARRARARAPVVLNYRSGEAPDHLRRSAIARTAIASVDMNVVPSRFLVDVFARFRHRRDDHPEHRRSGSLRVTASAIRCVRGSCRRATSTRCTTSPTTHPRVPDRAGPLARRDADAGRRRAPGSQPARAGRPSSACAHVTFAGRVSAGRDRRLLRGERHLHSEPEHRQHADVGDRGVRERPAGRLDRGGRRAGDPDRTATTGCSRRSATTRRWRPACCGCSTIRTARARWRARPIATCQRVHVAGGARAVAATPTGAWRTRAGGRGDDRSRRHHRRSRARRMIDRGDVAVARVARMDARRNRAGGPHARRARSMRSRRDRRHATPRWNRRASRCRRSPRSRTSSARPRARWRAATGTRRTASSRTISSARRSDSSSRPSIKSRARRADSARSSPTAAAQAAARADRILAGEYDLLGYRGLAVRSRPATGHRRAPPARPRRLALRSGQPPRAPRLVLVDRAVSGSGVRRPQDHLGAESPSALARRSGARSG